MSPRDWGRSAPTIETRTEPHKRNDYPPPTWSTEGIWGWARERSGNQPRGGKCLIHQVQCRIARPHLKRSETIHETCEVWKCPRCKDRKEAPTVPHKPRTTPRAYIAAPDTTNRT